MPDNKSSNQGWGHLPSQHFSTDLSFSFHRTIRDEGTAKREDSKVSKETSNPYPDHYKTPGDQYPDYYTGKGVRNRTDNNYKSRSSRDDSHRYYDGPARKNDDGKQG